MSEYAEPRHVVDIHAHGEAIIHHGSFRDYVIGFILSVILTAIPFWIVMDNVFRVPQVGAIVLMLFAMAQIIVHMIYFLHMSSTSEGGWTLMALIFTVVVLVIMLSGSLWIMQHLDTQMMPMSSEQMRNMP
ncbi:MAG: cytochrome o ubiquinol oxidase subunit IV [Acetobacteraceae bacterium]|nr:cytochrome o ubiquinol oxidase subunit IV [Acetobacteraceae bacterium]